MQKERATQTYSSIKANFFKLNGKYWYMFKLVDCVFMMEVNTEQWGLILVFPRSISQLNSRLSLLVCKMKNRNLLWLCQDPNQPKSIIQVKNRGVILFISFTELTALFCFILFCLRSLNIILQNKLVVTKQSQGCKVQHREYSQSYCNNCVWCQVSTKIIRGITL